MDRSPSHPAAARVLTRSVQTVCRIAGEDAESAPLRLTLDDDAVTLDAGPQGGRISLDLAQWQAVLAEWRAHAARRDTASATLVQE